MSVQNCLRKGFEWLQKKITASFSCYFPRYFLLLHHSNQPIGPVVTLRKNAKNNATNIINDPFEDYESIPMTTTEDNKICIGGQFALETTYNLNEQLGVFLKPQIRIYPSSLLPTEHVPGWRKIISCQIGAAYRF